MNNLVNRKTDVIHAFTKSCLEEVKRFIRFIYSCVLLVNKKPKISIVWIVKVFIYYTYSAKKYESLSKV